MRTVTYDAYLPKFEAVTSKYAFVSGEHLGRIVVIKHRICLTNSDTCPIHSSSYHPGHHQRRLERDEINMMLQDKVAESVTT